MFPSIETRIMAKTAIVTGASGGIGRACVEALARDHNIVIHYHSDREGAEEAETVAEANGAETIIHRSDLSDPEAAAGLARAAREEFGDIDVLVNNAGVFLERALPDHSIDDIDLTLGVNLAGPIHLTRAALPDLVDGGGNLVNVASTAGTRGSPTDPVYSASKGGLIAFTKAITRIYTADGLMANVVAPGAVATKMYREERRPAAREAIPIGRLMTPEDVAEAVRFFATTDAVSGEVLEVAGGQFT